MRLRSSSGGSGGTFNSSWLDRWVSPPWAATAGSFDQSHRQPQCVAQTRFSRRHLSVIFFMIVAREMKDAVQSENLNLLRYCMAEALRILTGQLRRNRDVPGQAVPVQRKCWEREHIRGDVLSAKALIQATKFAITCYQNTYLTPQFGCALGSRHKLRQPGPA
jgi:hypothetical protein